MAGGEPVAGGGRWTGPGRLLRVYGALLRSELQAATAYRSQLILGALGWVVPVAFMALWRGAAGGGEVSGITGAQFATYYAAVMLTTSMQLTQILSFEVEPLVHSGELSALMLRPTHPMHVLVARGLAQLTYKLTPLLFVVPALVALLGGSLTRDASQWALAAALSLPGLLCVVYLALMMGSLALWLTRSAALSGLLLGMQWLIGGLVAPVALMPGPLPEVLRHQPLWFAIGGPAEAVSGISKLSPWMLLEVLLWVALLHLAYRRMWRRGLLRYEAVGT